MSGALRGTVNLPGSKSESNRALMIAAYGGFPLEADNLSEAHDTVLLKSLLSQVECPAAETPFTVDCEDAGSVARFMMAYLAGKPGTWLLTGSPRLCERPMTPLVDALRQLGADIAGERLPVIINGKRLSGGSIVLDASQSSQFASSLLMAAPTLKEVVTLELKGDLVSMPYVEMTLKMMHHFGVQTKRDGRVVTIAPQTYQPRSFTVTADWSAASYWYEMMALGESGSMLLKGLTANSLQGDAAVADLFAKLGVDSEFLAEGVRISRTKTAPLTDEEPLVIDFKNTPDLFPSVFVTCIALNINSILIGVSTLKNKESDRIKSLITELSKIYTFINIVSDDKIIIEKSTIKVKQFDGSKVLFKTYGDHRIAMALAALRPQLGPLQFDAPSVVNKSYPRFWEELEKVL